MFKANSVRLEDLNKSVAIKVTKDGAQVPHGHLDLLTEARITSSNEHPGLVDVYRYGCVNGYVYSVMEWIDGWTLKELLKESGSLPITVCIDIGLKICDALAYLHGRHRVQSRRPVVHCDLKPANIMIDRFGQVKLIDLGVAWPIGEGWFSSGGVYGTPAYMAPEQLARQEPVPATDIFSLGAVLFEAFTQKRLFPERNVRRLVDARLSSWKDPFHTPDFEATSSRLFDAIVRRCTASRPEHRYTDTNELAKCLTMLKDANPYGPSLVDYVAEEIVDRVPIASIDTALFADCARCMSNRTTHLLRRNLLANNHCRVPLGRETPTFHRSHARGAIRQDGRGPER